ncbi:MAG: FkbM family methyltransferase [Potamolinea sp.]
MSFLSKFRTVYDLFINTGLWGVITYKSLPKPLSVVLSKLGLELKNRAYYEIHVKGYKYPVIFRYGSSDSPVLYQSLVREEYSCLEPSEDPKLIIDCGANVGYSSIFFINKYANAHVIAIEPDNDNFKVCEKNLHPYRERVSLIHSGIWSHKVGLTVCRGEKEESLEWEAQVRESKEGETPDISATDISSLLEGSGFNTIDILKMDVEKAEAIIFAKNYENWLSKVKNIVIELHNEECEKVFFNALSRYKYDLSRAGELTVCKNILPKD